MGMFSFDEQPEYLELERQVKELKEQLRIVHAQWIEGPGYHHWRCSACGFVEGIVLKLFYHYCPNCGAKMDEGD